MASAHSGPEQLKNGTRIGLEYMRRFSYMISLAGSNDVDRLVVIELLFADSPWPVKSLSEYIGYPRMTVRERLRDLEVQNLAVVGPKGASLTPFGMFLFSALANETHLIVMGEQQGYSSRIRELMTKLAKENASRKVTRPLRATPEFLNASFPKLRTPRDK